MCGIEPAPAIGCGGEPVRPDHHQHRIDLAQLRFDGREKILAGADVVDVAEHAVGAEFGFQRIGQAAGETGAVVTTIGEENARHGAVLH